MVCLNISMEAGKPVHYEIFWDDGNITVMDENCKQLSIFILLLQKYFILDTDAAPQQFDHFYADDQVNLLHIIEVENCHNQGYCL